MYRPPTKMIIKTKQTQTQESEKQLIAKKVEH
jgi:hypothetical protein